MLIGYAYEEQWYSFIGKQHFNYNHKSTSICCSFLWQQAIPFDSVQLFLSDYLKKIFETLPSASNDWRTCLQWIIDLQRVNLWRPWPWVFRPRQPCHQFLICIHYLFCCCPVDCTLQECLYDIGNWKSVFTVSCLHFVMVIWNCVLCFKNKCSW